MLVIGDRLKAMQRQSVMSYGSGKWERLWVVRTGLHYI